MPTLSSLWIIVAALSFGVMGVCVKFAAEFFGVLELVFYRSLLGCLLTTLVAGGLRKTLITRHFRVHCWRGVTGFISLCLFFYAVPRLPLSTAITLLQTSPLFLAVLTAVFLREKMSAFLLAALFLSFLGMVCILRPGVGGDDLLAGGAALGAGAMAGFAYFNVRRLGVLEEGGVRTVFYFTAISTLLSLILVFGYGEFSAMTAQKIGWAAAVGITATVGQLALTRGLHRGHTLVSAVLMYTSILFSGALDYALWGSVPDLFSWLGILLIAVSGIAAVSLNLRKRAAQTK